MRKGEHSSPKSRSTSKTLLLGQDARGHWVVQDRQHQRGGVFINRADALKFALFDDGNRPRAVILVPGILELGMLNTREEPGKVAAEPISGAKRAALRRVA